MKIGCFLSCKDAGVDELYVQQTGPDQDAFFTTWAETVIPRLAQPRHAAHRGRDRCILPSTGKQGGAWAMKEKRALDLREVSRDDHRGIVAVDGVLDIATAPTLKARLIEICDEGVSRLVVDLSPTSAIDSSGVTALVAVLHHMQREDGALAVVLGDTHTAERFEQAGVDRLLPIARTREEAVRRLAD